LSIEEWARRLFAPLLSALAPLIFAVGVVSVNTAEQTTIAWETREKLSELIKRGYELEKRGRELAYASEGLASWRVDYMWLRELRMWYDDALYILVSLMSRFKGVDEIKTNLLENARIVAGKMFTVVHHVADLISEVLYKHKIVSRGARIQELSPASAHVAWLLENVSATVESVTGLPCVWILGRLKPLNEYTMAGMYNDLTACHHRLLDYLSLVVDPETERVSERVFSLRGNPLLVDGCIKWERVLTELYMHGLIDPSDYHPTMCIVTGDRAGIRVGTAIDHTTHVELVNGAVRAYYYDVDEAVHEEVMKLAEKLGIRVVEHSPRNYTVLEVLVEKRDLLFKRLVPFISSMDERIRSPDRWKFLYFDMTSEEIKRVGEAELTYRAPEEFKRRFGVEL
jgi:hypothetical protein